MVQSIVPFPAKSWGCCSHCNATGTRPSNCVEKSWRAWKAPLRSSDEIGCPAQWVLEETTIALNMVSCCASLIGVCPVLLILMSNKIACAEYINSLTTEQCVLRSTGVPSKVIRLNQWQIDEVGLFVFFVCVCWRIFETRLRLMFSYVCECWEWIVAVFTARPFSKCLCQHSKCNWLDPPVRVSVLTCEIQNSWWERLSGAAFPRHTVDFWRPRSNS